MLLRSPLSTQDATCTWAFVRFEASRTSRVWNRLLLSIHGGDSTRAFRRCTRVYVRRKPVQNHRRANICWPATLICAEPSNDVSKMRFAHLHGGTSEAMENPEPQAKAKVEIPRIPCSGRRIFSAQVHLAVPLQGFPLTSHNRIQLKISSRHPFLQDPPPF